jgi:hypothetical protein
MKKFVLALTLTVLLGNAKALADTQTFTPMARPFSPSEEYR